VTLTVWDGTDETAVDFTLWDGTAERPASAAMVPGGAYSVANLFARPGFVMAHRGGSVDWAEMTARAYTESVFRSVDALEVSVNRTADGVWFGLHDQTLLRTSGVDLDPLTMTWDQVRGYLCAPPADGDATFGARPYMRLVDLLAAYATSHVIFLDPKYRAGAQWRDELYSVVESVVPNAQQHVVIKYSGGGTSLADDASARGYSTWGYFYQSEYLADPAGVLANAAHWTYLGLDISAPQGTWDVFHATGKTVLGHIAATLIAYQTAIAKGAGGVMSSGVRAIKGAPVI